MEQATPGEELFLLLDGVLTVVATRDQLARRGAVVLPAAYQSAQRADDLDVEDRGGLEDRVGVGEQVGGA